MRGLGLVGKDEVKGVRAAGVIPEESEGSVIPIVVPRSLSTRSNHTQSQTSVFDLLKIRRFFYFWDLHERLVCAADRYASRVMTSIEASVTARALNKKAEHSLLPFPCP